jgi:hypothetical protein
VHFEKYIDTQYDMGMFRVLTSVTNDDTELEDQLQPRSFGSLGSAPNSLAMDGLPAPSDRDDFF